MKSARRSGYTGSCDPTSSETEAEGVPDTMQEPTATKRSLADEILDRVEKLLEEARGEQRPLEVDPYRSRLFELFVMAEAAGFLQEEAEHDLTADGLCRELSRRWGLDEAARQSFQQQARLPAQHLDQMRALWSLMRMWMEWTYAWQRWEEFHNGAE